MLHVVVPEFWGAYTQAMSALLTGDLIKWMFYSERIFPQVAKCIYEPYGPSGSNQIFDAICLLPSNILNQKIFMIIWVWYILQMAISVSNILYWIVIAYSKEARIHVLHVKTLKSVSHKVLNIASKNAQFGHFFLLNQIAKNVNTMTFFELLSCLVADETNLNENANESIATSSWIETLEGK